MPTGIGRLVAKLVAFGCIVAAGPATAAPALEGVEHAPSLACYESVFSGYRRFAHQSVGDWREANAVVGRIGGWQAYARESQGSAAAAPRGDGKATDAPPSSAHDAHHR